MELFEIIEAYTYTLPKDTGDGEDSITWDVSEAKRRVEKRYFGIDSPTREVMQEIVDKQGGFTDEDVNRSDPSIPGIAAPIFFNGKIWRILIDGNKRLYKALRDGLPFSVKLMTAEDSKACIVKCTNRELIPKED